MMRKLTALIAGALLASSLLFGSVRRVKVPQEGVAPDVAVGPSGEVYLVFAQAKNAFFSFSQDDGRTFSPPVRINTAPDTILGAHERGPKIAVGKKRTLHVVWMDNRNTQLEYSRRAPGSNTFSQPRNLLDTATHFDEATVAADNKGNVLVSWLDARLPDDPRNPVSLPVFLARSADNGLSFAKDRPLRENPLLRAYSCCALKSFAGSDGRFYLAFRGGYNNIRDMFLVSTLMGSDNSGTTVEKIQDDEWRFEGCPMSGPSLAPASRPSEVWVAWMSKGRVYFAQSTDAGKHFGEAHTPRSDKPDIENHPLVLLNKKSEVFLAWEEGQTIRWQITNRTGEVLDSGEAGTLTSNSKATGFVDREGNFCLVF
jgi:hypothetical protein